MEVLEEKLEGKLHGIRFGYVTKAQAREKKISKSVFIKTQNAFALEETTQRL